MHKTAFCYLLVYLLPPNMDQYRTVEFINAQCVTIVVNRPADDLTVGAIRRFVENALAEILNEIRLEK